MTTAGLLVWSVVGVLAPDARGGVSASRPTSRPITRPVNPVHIRARRFYEEGVRLLRSRQYQRAILNLRASIRLHPDGPHAARARTHIEVAEREVRRRQARRFFDQGLALVREARFKNAITSLNASIRLYPDGPHVPRARGHLQTIGQQGRDRLTLAQDLLAKRRYLLAHEQFEAVADQFDGLPVAEEARGQVRALAANPDFVKARRRAEAGVLLEKARAHDREQRIFFACTRYRGLIEAYPDTPAADAARKRLREFDADPALRERIQRQKAEHETAEWFAMAENYRTNAERLTGTARTRFLARAREFYQRIVATHPTSPLAAKARAALAKLDKTDK